MANYFREREKAHEKKVGWFRQWLDSLRKPKKEKELLTDGTKKGG